MCIERVVRLFAGTIILVSLLLARLVSPWFLLATAFVGVNLFQAALSGWCLLVTILRRLGVAECPPSTLRTTS